MKLIIIEIKQYGQYMECLFMYSLFCRESSELFATSSKNDVRVWHTETGKELLRISVPNITCHTINITPDGKAIITGT